MSRVVVTQVNVIEKRAPLADENTYQVRSDRPAVWLQRVLCWALAKIGAYRLYDDITYERIVFDTDDFMDRLYRSCDTVLRFNHKPKQLLIGAEDFAELMNLPAMRELFSFRAEDKVFGLEVKVVPWMRGILVMP